jgi:hypothetical protein
MVGYKLVDERRRSANHSVWTSPTSRVYASALAHSHDSVLAQDEIDASFKGATRFECCIGTTNLGNDTL